MATGAQWEKGAGLGMGSWERDVLCESDNHIVGILAVFRRALLYSIWQQNIN